MTRASTVIDEVILREGDRYTNHPSDRGGPTKYGITQRTLSAYRGQPVTPEDVENLTVTEARNVYFALYVRSPGFSKIINDDIMGLAVDCGVLHGTDRTIRWLQKIVGVKQDGILGPVTADAINRFDKKSLYNALISERVRFIGSIITRDPSQAVFAAGWLNRAMSFLEA